MNEISNFGDCSAQAFNENRSLHRRVLAVMVEDSNEDLWVKDFQPCCDYFGGLEIKELCCVSEMDVREAALGDWGELWYDH